MMTLEVFSVILVINIITNFQPKLGHMRVGNALEKKLMPSKEKKCSFDEISRFFFTCFLFPFDTQSQYNLS